LESHEFIEDKEAQQRLDLTGTEKRGHRQLEFRSGNLKR